MTEVARGRPAEVIQPAGAPRRRSRRGIATTSGHLARDGALETMSTVPVVADEPGRGCQ